jgi:hypothetical protein
VDEVRREEARNNYQIKGRRYIFLKNVENLTMEEKEALSQLEAQNLDTTQAMQIRMNLQQLFTMGAKSARRFLLPLERLGSDLRSGADEEARQDDHGKSGRHPAIHRHWPFQRRFGGDQRQRPGRKTQSQRLSDQAKPQDHRLPDRWRCSG